MNINFIILQQHYLRTILFIEFHDFSSIEYQFLFIVNIIKRIQLIFILFQF